MLVTGKLPANISKRLVVHLIDPRQFWPRYPIPSVALDDPAYHPDIMWQGPTWVNVNYLLIEGLERSGYADVARTLRRSTLDMMYGREGIYEYYNPDTGGKPPEAATIFGWSSAIFIDLAIQETKMINRTRE